MCPVHRYIFCRSHQVTLDSRSHQNYVVGTFDQAARRPARRSTTTYQQQPTATQTIILPSAKMLLPPELRIAEGTIAVRPPSFGGGPLGCAGRPILQAIPPAAACLIPEASTRAVESDCPEASSAAGVRPAAAAARSTVPAAPFFKPSHQQPPT